MVNIELTTSSTKEKVNKYSEYCIVTTMPDGSKVRGLIYDESNTEAINQLFEIFDLRQRGAIVFGGTGSGKTLIFSMLQKVVPKTDLRFFVKVNVLDIVTEFNKEGHDVFSKFRDRNILFDDLGTEDKGLHYGDRIEVMEKFIQLRYDLFVQKGLITHLTTNLTTAEILARYGARCVSRLKEMTDMVLLGVNESYTDRRILRNFIGFPHVVHPVQKSKEDIEWEKNYKEAMEESKARPMQPTNFKGLGTRHREFLDQWEQLAKSNISDSRINGKEIVSKISQLIPMNPDNSSFINDIMTLESYDMNSVKQILIKHLANLDLPQKETWKTKVVESFNHFNR